MPSCLFTWDFQCKMTFKHIRHWEGGLISGCCRYFTQGPYHAWSSYTPGQIVSAVLLFYILMLLIYMQSSFSPGQVLFSQPPPVPKPQGICLQSQLIEQWGKSWWGCSMEMPNSGRCRSGVYIHKYIHEQQQESRIYWCLPLSPELWWRLCQLSYFQCSFV